MPRPQPQTLACEDVNFDGYRGRLSRGDAESPHSVTIVYGGDPGPNRGGKGFVYSRDGVFIHQWRRPAREHNAIVVNDLTSTEFPLRAHGL